MNTLEAILSRRSIRKYQKLPIDDTIIKELLTAAMAAPSACNAQDWQFIIIDDKALFKKISSINPHAKMCEQAPMSILICGDTRLQVSEGFWIQDCAAATQNLLLAAHEKGLGAVWTGVYPDEARVAALQKLFSLPKGVIPLSLVVLGYPAETKSQEDRFKEDRIHYNKW